MNADLQDNEPEAEDMLRDLLATGYVLVNCMHWRKDWPEEARDVLTVGIVCNDLFGPGADAEMLPMSQLETAWRMHTEDKQYLRGLMAWCVMRRKTMPWSKGMRLFEGSKWNVAMLAKPESEPERESESESEASDRSHLSGNFAMRARYGVRAVPGRVELADWDTHEHHPAEPA
jgi:hypothetical protein